MAEIRGLSAFTIVGHLEWLVRADENLDLSHVPPPPERVSEIEAAFKNTGANLLPPVRELLGDGYFYEELRFRCLDTPRK